MRYFTFEYRSLTENTSFTASIRLGVVSMLHTKFESTTHLVKQCSACFEVLTFG